MLAALFDGAHPKLALLGIGLGHGLDHRQGQLAFAEIIADVLAGCIGLSLIIQQVIDDLKGNAQGVAIVKQRLYLCRICIRDDTANFGGGRKQCRRLAAHNLQIDAFVGRQIARRRQLQHLALGDGGRGV